MTKREGRIIFIGFQFKTTRENLWCYIDIRINGHLQLFTKFENVRKYNMKFYFHVFFFFTKISIQFARILRIERRFARSSQRPSKTGGGGFFL